MADLGAQFKSSAEKTAKYADSMREARRYNLNKVFNPQGTDAESKRRLLEVDAGKLTAIKDAISTGAKQVYDSVASFLTDLLGDDWKSYVPESWTIPSFSWEDLANFDFETALDDFILNNNLEGLTNPESMKDVYDAISTLESKLCSPEEFTPGEKVPTTCSGPSVSIAFVPKTCVLDPADKVAVCDPAKILLNKNPGSCSLVHKTPSTWTGKECKVEKEFGSSDESMIVGGREYAVDLGSIKLNTAV